MGKSIRRIEDTEMGVFPASPTVADIHRLGDVLRQCEPIHCPTNMCFANGMAARTMSMEADQLVIGRMHKHEHLFVVLYGDLTITGVDGTRRMGPGDMMASKPYAKRVIRSHAASMMLTVHRTDTTDEALLPDELLVPESDETDHEMLQGVTP